MNNRLVTFVTSWVDLTRTYMPPTGWKFGLLRGQLDGGHLYDDLQTPFLELLCDTLLGRVVYFLEWTGLRLDRLAEGLPFPLSHILILILEVRWVLSQILPINLDIGECFLV